MRLPAAAFFAMLLPVLPAVAQDAQGLNEKWMAAFNKGDAARVTSLYTEDATLLPSGAPLVLGRAAIEAFGKGASGEIGDIVLKSEGVTALGPDAASDI